MHVVLVGATGLVGSAALQALLHSSAVTRISIFSRSQVEQATDSELARSKCEVFSHADFAKPPDASALGGLRDARGCIWALGVSTNAVNASTYEEITLRWPVEWSRSFIDAGLGSNAKPALFNFVYVSGEGATVKPGLMTPLFGRIKGQAEVALLDLSKAHPESGYRAYSARAGAVDRSRQPEISKYVADREGLQKKLEKPVRAVLRVVYQDIISPTKELGDALVRLATGSGDPLSMQDPGVSGDGWILGNIALRKLAGI